MKERGRGVKREIEALKDREIEEERRHKREREREREIEEGRSHKRERDRGRKTLQEREIEASKVRVGEPSTEHFIFKIF